MPAAHSENLRAHIRASLSLIRKPLPFGPVRGSGAGGIWRMPQMPSNEPCNGQESPHRCRGVGRAQPPGGGAASPLLIMNGRMVRTAAAPADLCDLTAGTHRARLMAVIADDEDWNAEGAVAAAATVGTFGIAVTDSSRSKARRPQLSQAGPGPDRPSHAGYVLER